MKNFKIFCTLFAATVLFSCTNTATDTTTIDDNQIENGTSADSSTQNMVNEGDSSAARLGDMVNMYQDVGLTEDQIDKFEADYQRKVDALKTHGRGDYDKQSIEATKDQSMRTVTSDDEYQRYLDWKKNNPVEY